MKKIILFVFFLIFLFSAQAVLASGDFASSFDVTYSINNTGVTHAVFDGTLTNTTDTKYASSYTLQVGFADVENIVAADDVGKIIPKISGNKITLPLNTHVVGKGETVNFSLTFNTKDVASHNGDIWEINIPGIANQEDFDKFTVHLSVPSSFGQVAYVKPVNAGDNLDFDKSILGSSGISLAFGKNQSYAFTLLYHLANSNLFPTETEIALPPATNYQDVALDDISPRPENVIEDADGNWLAKYNLLPSQKITVTVKGHVTEYLHPKSEILSPEMRKVYLEGQPFWETSDSEIKKLAQDLKTPEEVYQYVVHHLSYDFSRVAGTQSRVGAAEVLKNPTSAVCLEFTDLFIAIARAAGIPAREVDGYAFTQNQEQRPQSIGKDILHAWPEYYDDSKHAWIMVDPTWENTTKGVDYFSTLDFDHVAFVIHGTKSTYPISAGGYKFPDTTVGKDVRVTFGPMVSNEDQKAGIDFSIAPSLFSGFPVVGTLFVKNAGTELISSQEVSILARGLSPSSQTIKTQTIPPFGYATQTIGFDKTSLLTNDTKRITIELAGNTITKSVKIYPLFVRKEYIIGGIVFVILCLVLFIIAARSRRVSVPR